MCEQERLSRIADSHCDSFHIWDHRLPLLSTLARGHPSQLRNGTMAQWRNYFFIKKKVFLKLSCRFPLKSIFHYIVDTPIDIPNCIMALSETTVETVKATIPVLRKHANAVVLKFYETLFVRYPSIKSYFNV